MPALRAIETVYKGYRFRSRLEARWAVFFDALEITWQYEVEGYQLPSGWYLPDFWLPKTHKDFFGCHVEIKSFDSHPLTTTETDERKDFKLCNELAEATQRPVLLCFGDPVDDHIWQCTIDHIGYEPDPFWMFGYLSAVGSQAYHASLKARQARFEHGETV